MIKRFLNSKNFIISISALCTLLLCIVLVQFISIATLSAKQNSLNAELSSLKQQEQKYNNMINNANDDSFIEDYAKDELNQKNSGETVVVGK